MVRRSDIKIFSISILGLCFVLTGCGVSAPTYGTGKAASLQFFGDIANLTSLTPTNNKSQIVMKPHPELVIPKLDSRLVLPLPQKDGVHTG